VTAFAAVHATEAAFQAAVVEQAALTGWRTYHPYDSRLSNAGWPDLVLVRGAELIAAELKSERGRVTVDQRAWLDALNAVRVIEARLWRPSDVDTIAARLQRPRLGQRAS
jgi:hypothetical protein